MEYYEGMMGKDQITVDLLECSTDFSKLRKQWDKLANLAEHPQETRHCRDYSCIKAPYLPEANTVHLSHFTIYAVFKFHQWQNKEDYDTVIWTQENFPLWLYTTLFYYIKKVKRKLNRKIKHYHVIQQLYP